MNLELPANRALALCLGHMWGLIPLQHVVKIAEEIILSNENTPSSEICELAVCRNNYDLKEKLMPFSKSADKWESIKQLLNEIQLLSLNKENQYKLYYYLSNFIEWDDPKQWVKIKVLTHELSDARTGVYGDEAEISNEIFETLLGLSN